MVHDSTADEQCPCTIKPKNHHFHVSWPHIKEQTLIIGDFSMRVPQVIYWYQGTHSLLFLSTKVDANGYNAQSKHT